MATTKKIVNSGNKNSQRDVKRQSSGQKSSKATEFAQENVKLSDYDMISDVLKSDKALIGTYGTALCEIDCPNLREIINQKMMECAEDQLDAFKYMNERNMYKTEPAPMQKIKETRQKYTVSLKN